MTSSRLRWRSIAGLFFILLLSVLTACSQSGLTDEEYDDDYTGPRVTDEYFMVPAGSRSLEGEVTEGITVRVYLYERDTSEPVANREVSFALLADEEEENLPSLSSRAAFTGDDGEAEITVYFGTEMGTWGLRADNPSSNAVDFELTSLPTEVGMIAVDLINAAPSIMTLSDIDVRVYREDRFRCDQFNPYGQQEESVLDEAYSPFTETTLEFDGLGTRNRYTVTAIARGEHGQIAAGGCVGSLLVQHEEVTNVEMVLQLIPLNPSGIYDVISHWDFTDAIADSGAIGAAIVRVLDVFDNPGVAIYNEIIALIGNLVGGIISSTLDLFLSATGLDATFQNMINNFIENNEALVQIRDAGRDLRDVIANLQVHSELSIGKLASDFEFRGQDNWLGLTLYWRWDCGPSDGPECGAIEILPDSDGTFADLGVLSSNWTGRVVAYDQLQIDQHPVSLRYGRLIIYVINEVIIPTVTDGNANSMSEAFAYWIGCDSLAATLLPDGEICAYSYCLEASTVESVCNTAVSTLFGFADILINSLEFDMGLRLGGEGRLVEETSNGIVDRIDHGLYEGVIQGDGGGSSPFSATWEAVRHNPNF